MLKTQFFRNNREKFMSYFKKGEIFILEENIPFSKRDSEFFNIYNMNLFYLTGIEQEETKLLLFKDLSGECHEILFILEKKPELELWEGEKLSINNSIKISGIKNIKLVTDYPKLIEKISKKSKIISSIIDERDIRKNYELDKKISSIKKKYKLKFENRINDISKLRCIKNNSEIELMKYAAKITFKGFDAVLRKLKNMKNEKEIESLLSYEYNKNFCSHSYHPIVASGLDSCTLHYIKNLKKLKKNQLVLIDSGAEFENYKCDVTRTFPISGKFSIRQKKIYNAVLDVQKFALKEIKVGITPRDWERKVALEMLKKIKELKLDKNIQIDLKNKESIKILRKYYPHGTGHFLGLDTHDLGDYSKPFEENQVMTVEPGLYIKEEGIGIRIEDNVLLRKKRNVVLTKRIPKEIDDIERIMKKPL